VLAAAVCLLVLPTVAPAETPTLVELSTSERAYLGTSLWHDSDQCALLQQDGSIVRLMLSDVESFRQISPRFRPMTANQLVRELRKEFRNLQVDSSGNSIVVAPNGMARELAELHHDTWGVYQDYFRRRDFDVSRSEMPFVTVVYPTFDEFSTVAETHGVQVSSTMKGYYHALSNRIVMFVPPDVASSSDSSGLHVPQTAFASIDEVDLLQTLAHEAVHQFGFNTGLHRRIGDNPRWVVEGLAMQFEGEAGLASNTATQQQRMNRDRFVWYMQSMSRRQTPELLQALITGDELFVEDAVGAYSLAWGLTFFLMETQREDFVDYLSEQAALAPEQSLDGPAAIERFEDAFGRIESVNASFLRFMNSLDQ
jgi:hypothetical protein